jgi:predicted TIM-barrel fold metal-dependent hydrolase
MTDSNSLNHRTAHRIDIHHHVVPVEYVKALQGIGITTSGSVPFPKWSQNQSLGIMDQNDIAAAITSISSPGVYFGNPSFARELARRCNEFSAGLVQANPERFGFFATLPLPDGGASVFEAVYALDTLAADGVVLLASNGDKYLGHPDFNELMEELNRRKAVVFVHPNLHSSSAALNLDIPAFYIEFLFDTTRAITNLIFSGTAERYPEIRWIFAHAGGTVPYITWRLSLGDFDPKILERAPRGVLAYLKSFYYDTGLSTSPYALRALFELVPPTQILFGSDFPFAPAPLVVKEVNDLQAIQFLDDNSRNMVDRTNALGLFPRFQTAADKEQIPSSQSQRLHKHRKIPAATRLVLRLMRMISNP